MDYDNIPCSHCDGVGVCPDPMCTTCQDWAEQCQDMSNARHACALLAAAMFVVGVAAMVGMARHALRRDLGGWWESAHPGEDLGRARDLLAALAVQP